MRYRGEEEMKMVYRIRAIIWVIAVVAGMVTGCGEKPKPMNPHMVFWPPDMIPHPPIFPEPDNEPEIV